MSEKHGPSCPACGCTASRVINTRQFTLSPRDGQPEKACVRRQRACEWCAKQYYTTEETTRARR